MLNKDKISQVEWRWPRSQWRSCVQLLPGLSRASSRPGEIEALLYFAPCQHRWYVPAGVETEAPITALKICLGEVILKL